MTRDYSAVWAKLEQLGGYFVPGSEISKSEVEDEIRAVEDSVGAELPIDYKDFVLWSGGREMAFNWDTRVPAPKPYEDIGLDTLSGFDQSSTASVPSQAKTARGFVPSGAWVIGLDPGGNKFCLNSSDGSVYYWDHETSGASWKSLYRLADSFEALVNLAISDRKPGDSVKSTSKRKLVIPPMKKASRKR